MVRQHPRKTTTDRQLDEALEQTFPASDPPANTVETGIALQAAQDDELRVTDNQKAQRFELDINGEVAFLTYQQTQDSLRLVHTEVPPALRGRHLGERLVKEALEAARARGLQVIALCPFVRKYLRKHANR